MIHPISIDTVVKPVEGHILPFVPKGPVEIFQGYNGPHSHFAFTRGSGRISYDYRFGLDFKLPLGTEVIASKEGRIHYIINRSHSLYRGLDSEKGFYCSPNFLIVEHSDGLKSCYSHLDGSGIFVEIGQKVKQGQPLAKTGLSGWVGPVPHLHFQVYHRTQTFPVNFTNYFGQLEHKLLNNNE